ncbi:MAG: fluoride efflux transporter CrcB [Thermomicrobiales bacterium]|nr:fluoride efflux transporter CrcB [Thermomicrobiales bacterium]
MLVFLVAIGAFFGAIARFLVVDRIARRVAGAFPYGTLLVNLTGSFALGVIATLIAERYGGDRAASLLLATGFLGAYTTFSSFSYETVLLLEAGAFRPALANVVGSTAGGIALALTGVLLTRAVI